MTLLLLLNAALAGKDDPPKQPWFERTSVEAEETKVELRDAFLNKKEATFKFTFVNLTDSYLAFDMSKTELELTSTMYGTRRVLVAPGKRKKHNVRLESKDLYTLTPKVRFTDVSYAKPLEGEPLEPVGIRNALVKAGGVSCKPDKSIGQNAKFTELKFLCSNNGANVGVLQPNLIAMVTENGTSFATLDEVPPKLLEPGKRYEFKLRYEARRPLLDAHGKAEGDKQLASAMLDFSKSLHEAEWTPVNLPEMSLTYDPVATVQNR